MARPSDALNAPRRYGGMDRTARDAARRARLIEAALDAFATDGYGASAIDGICRRAQVSTRNFYDHFAGREDLLRAVYDEIITAVAGAVIAALDAAPPTLEGQARASLDVFAACFAEDERRARVNFVEVIGVSRALEEHRRAILRMFAAIIAGRARGLADLGVIERRDFGPVAMALVGATQESLIDWVLTEERPSVDDVVEVLVDVYVRALGPADPEAEARALATLAER